MHCLVLSYHYVFDVGLNTCVTVFVSCANKLTYFTFTSHFMSQLLW